MKNPSEDEEPKNRNSVEAPGAEKIFHSEKIFEGRREIIILHGDSRYRLQVTKAGKLILIK
jgi:hemin uptake protein HemP